MTALLLLALAQCPTLADVPAPGSCTVSDAGVPSCAPGEVDPAMDDIQKLCAAGGTQYVRCHPDAAMRKRLLAAYGLTEAKEIDHFIPECLAGAQSVRNLWPQKSPAAKDRLEARLCRAVCRGDLSLDAARVLVVNPANWVAK